MNTATQHNNQQLTTLRITIVAALGGLLLDTTQVLLQEASCTSQSTLSLVLPSRGGLSAVRSMVV